MDARKITIKRFTDNKDDHYQQLLLNVLRAPKDPKAGTQFSEIEKMMPIVEQVKKVKVPAMGDAQLLVSESDWTSIVEKVKSFPFGSNSEEVYAFCQAVVNAPKVKVSEVNGDLVESENKKPSKKRK